MKHALGIDIGSTTVKVTIINESHDILFSDYKRHFANIKGTLQTLLSEAREKLGNLTIHPTVTGSGGMAISEYLHIPFCQEVVCVANALQDYEPKTDVAIELGGEDAKIIYFTWWQYRTAYERYLCRRYRFIYRSDGKSLLTDRCFRSE